MLKVAETEKILQARKIVINPDRPTSDSVYRVPDVSEK